MWYLPMLFWCFVGGISLSKIKISDSLKLLLSACLNIFYYLPITLPLQIGRSTDFIFYFYLGYVCYKHSNYLKNIFQNRRQIIFAWIIFVIIFVILRILRNDIIIGDQTYLINRFLTMWSQIFFHFVYATLDTLLFYTTISYYVKQRTLKSFTIKLATCSFGIYLFQEFILKIIYYKTNFALEVEVIYYLGSVL